MCAELPCTGIRLTDDLTLSDGLSIPEGTVGMVRDDDLDQIKIEVEFRRTGRPVSMLVPIRYLARITSDSVVQVPRSVPRSGSGETENYGG